MIKYLLAFFLMIGAAFGQLDYVLTDGDNLFTVSGGVTSGPGSRIMMSWSSDNLANRWIDIFGTAYVDGNSGLTVDTATTNTVTEGYNRHLILDVTSTTTLGNVTFSGFRIDEDTGAISTNFIESLAVTGTGCVQTATKWIGAINYYTTNGADLVVDEVTTTYVDLQNRGFVPESVRMGFRPSNPVWEIRLEVCHIRNNGSVSNMVADLMDYTSSDLHLRAGNGVIGHGKLNLGNHHIEGNNNEGIVVRLTGTGGTGTPSHIREVDIFIILRYDPQDLP